MSPNFWRLREICCSLLQLSELFACEVAKYAQQWKLKQDLMQDMFRYIFRRTPPPPPPTKKYIYQISNAKKSVFCLLRCLLIGLTNINVWPKTAGMISFLLLTWDGHFKTPLIVLLSMLHFSGLVLMGINWQIPPSGRKLKRRADAFCFYKYSLLTIHDKGYFEEQVSVQDSTLDERTE